ncbi:MAG: TetR/AcrR family transcriptional regulator [Povalibacter sp.]
MDTKDKILEQALLELEGNGVDGFSLRAVSNAVGITPMAIYRHFRDKDHLLEAVGQQAFAEWQERIAAIKSRDPVQWFKRSARAYVEFALDEPARFDACFVLKTHVERVYPEGFAARKSPVVTQVMERIEMAQSSGYLRAGDPLEMALYVWAELHGLAMLHRAGRFSLKRSEFLALCDRCIERALDSLRADSSKPRRSS